MKITESSKPTVYQLIVLPNTGIQICRNFKGPQGPIEELWKAATQTAQKQANYEVVQLVKEHIACNQALEATGWIACDPNDFVFFRLTRIGGELYLDLVVDTQNGGGAQVNNKIPVLLQGGGLRVFHKPYHLADIYVENHHKARHEIGSLIMDFGNSGSAFVFSRGGAGPLQARVVQANNPFDPRYQERPSGELNILRSNMVVLRVGHNDKEAPWIVLGDRAEELIKEYPLTSYLYAPKKYVRHWPPHLRAPEPSMKFRGILGQRDGLYPMLDFVQYTLDQMLEQVLASLTNPHGTSDAPDFYPQVARIMLTYPLTWRKVDREIFQSIIEKTAARLLVQEKRVKSQFKVELVCSEPVAVAAYALWEIFFHFETENLALAASFLGNTRGTPELRLLVVDIGGGSTDIAYVDVKWTVKAEDQSVDVTFKMLESMRFNRAGDRLSHIIATAIHEYIREKYGISESLDFDIESRNPAFTRSYKRRAVSEISKLAETAKVALASTEGRWALDPADERELMRTFEPLNGGSFEQKVQQGPHLKLERDILKSWVEADRQSLETNGEPGFIDIFLYLEALCDSLRATNREPHIVILSGRSTRLPFIKEMAARYLRLPPHRIRTLDQLLPDSLKLQGFANMDKLAVVCGAQRFRFGDHIRFVSLPDAPIFNRYIGTVKETSTGLKLNKIFIHPGDNKPRTITVAIGSAKDVRIGHAFRENGVAQVIANLSNNSYTERYEVQLDILDDFSVKMDHHEDIILTEWVPGGNDFIVDNFNDTGRIDIEPEGFLRHIVLQNRNCWLGG